METKYIVVNSTFDFIEKLTNILEDSPEINLYFRGENTFHEKRIPNLYREKNLFERGPTGYYKDLINELGINNISNSQSLFKTISELQHYEAKTAFLDVTKNPLIALFFAAESNKASHPSNKENPNDGYIYVYKIHRSSEKHPSGATLGFLTALNFIEPRKIRFFKSYLNIIYHFLSNNDIHNGRISISNTPINSKFYLSSLKLKKLFEILNKFIGEDKILTMDGNGDLLIFGNPASNELSGIYQAEKIRLKNQGTSDRECHEIIEKNFLDDIEFHLEKVLEKISTVSKSPFRYEYPIGIYLDMAKANFVTPAKDTDRIRQQQGAFIYPCFPTSSSWENALSEIDTSIAHLQYKDSEQNNIVFKVPSHFKHKILKELRIIGINPGFIYADIKSRSESLINPN